MIELLTKIITNVLTALYQPFGFSLVLSFFVMFFYLFAYQSKQAGKEWKGAVKTWFITFKESLFFRKLFFLVFVISLILFRTLWNRDMWMNPLADVMGGWSIWEIKNGEKILTTGSIENVIMMIPFSFMLLWTFNTQEKTIQKSIKYAFLFSLCIETTQLLLRCGTFQISDLVYNTLGGCIGGLIYCGFTKCSGTRRK